MPLAEDIPAGGLFTGAEVPKTAAQVAQCGGIEGAQLEPCYHAACDTFVGTGDGRPLLLEDEGRREDTPN